MFISAPVNGRAYVAERSRKGTKKSLWSVMPMEPTSGGIRIEAREVPRLIRRKAYRPLQPNREEPPTKKIIIAAALTLAVLVAPATGAEVPAQYRGLWCEGKQNGHYRCKVQTSEAGRYIKRHDFNITEEGDCRVRTVTPTAKGHRLRMRCTGMSEAPEEMHDVHLWLDARGRLHWE
jgi:hypothetical protein